MHYPIDRLLDTPATRDKIYQHLVDLPSEDRYTRFCGHMADEAIKRYVDRIPFEDTQFCFGVTNDSGDLIGFCHVAFMTDEEAEIAFSTSVEHRQQGIGEQMFDRGVALCIMHGRTKIFMNCLAENTAVQKFARKRNMRVVTSYAESQAILDASERSWWAAATESVTADVISLFDMSLQCMFNQNKN